MRAHASGAVRMCIAVAWAIVLVLGRPVAGDTTGTQGDSIQSDQLEGDSVAVSADEDGEGDGSESSITAPGTAAVGPVMTGTTLTEKHGDSVEGEAATERAGKSRIGRRLRVAARKAVPRPLRTFARWLYGHLLHIVALISSLGIIGVTFAFYFSRRERKRFLTTTRLSIMDKEVQKACRYIEKHHDDSSMTVESICAELVTGEAFLEALFEKELGMNVESFVEQVRVNRARILLTKQPGLPAAEVGHLTGFSDETAFREAFRRVTQTDFDQYLGSSAAAEAESDRYLSERPQ